LNSDSENLSFELFGQRETLLIKLNDPVFFNRNKIDADIQNGTLGTLVSLANEHLFGEVQVDFSGEIIELTLSLFESIRTAYSMSLH
jgi:ATP-dependent exoDNAse (exonuclease V) alpha subunit